MKRPTGGCKWAPRAPRGGAPLAREVCARREPGPSPRPEVPARLTWGGDRATGLSGSPRSRHCSPLQHDTAHTVHVSVLPGGAGQQRWLPPRTGQLPSPRTQPRLTPAAHKPSAQAQPLRNTPGKLRYGLFLSSPDSVGTLPYSLLTAGKTSAQSFFFFFKYIHIHIYTCVCGHMYMHVDGYIYTHTHILA